MRSRAILSEIQVVVSKQSIGMLLRIAFPEVMAKTEVLICTSWSIPEGSLAFHKSLQSLAIKP